MSNDYYGPRREDYQSGRAWLWWLTGMVVFLIVCGVILSYVGFFAQWATVPTKVFSPENVQMLSRQANDRRQALDAQLATINALETKLANFTDLYGEDKSKWPQGMDDEYLQVQQQIFNMKAAFNQQCGQYMAMFQDEWRSLPAPKDLDTYCEFTQ